MDDPRSTIPCDFCGADISKMDFEVGRAVTLMKKSYCSPCMLTAIEQSKREDFVPQFLTPRPGELSSPLKPGSNE